MRRPSENEVQIPFDPIGILAGFPRIDWRSFALASALGSSPSTLALVLSGASIETDLSDDGFGLDPGWAAGARGLLTSPSFPSWQVSFSGPGAP